VASGSPVNFEPVQIEPGGFLSMGECLVFTQRELCMYRQIASSEFLLIAMTSKKLTEREAPGGDAPIVYICITGRPLTFPGGDQ
jgi:hypothetical protein